MKLPIDLLSDVAEAPLCRRHAEFCRPTRLRADRGSERDLRTGRGGAVAASHGAQAPWGRA